ncbi:MAG: four helix bundle protein [Proteobacteria bacterium]|nr:four helix bundle protein [Pseudomonadota bacterium]
MFVSYRQLDVYRRAYRMALGLHKVSLKLPQIEQYAGVADQMRRASKSVCSNLAEGLSKNASKVEERRFLGLSLGSCEEMQVWLEFGVDLEYWPRKKYESWAEEYREIAKMIQALMKRRENARG